MNYFIATVPDGENGFDNDNSDNYCYMCCTFINSAITPSIRVCTCISEGKLPHTAYCNKCDVSWSLDDINDNPCECIQGSMFDDILIAFEPCFKKLDELYTNMIQNAWYKNSNKSHSIKIE